MILLNSTLQMLIFRDTVARLGCEIHFFFPLVSVYIDLVTGSLACNWSHSPHNLTMAFIVCFLSVLIWVWCQIIEGTEFLHLFIGNGVRWTYTWQILR